MKIYVPLEAIDSITYEEIFRKKNIYKARQIDEFEMDGDVRVSVIHLSEIFIRLIVREGKSQRSMRIDRHNE